MSKSKGALTNAQIEGFRGGAKYEFGKNKGQVKPQDVLWCSEASGFGIRLGLKTGIKTFFLQYRVAGRLKDVAITIGRYGEPLWVDGKVVPLDVNRARAKALELKAKMRLGIDPVAEAQQKREATVEETAVDKARTTTLQEVLEHFLIHHRTKHGELRPRTKADYRYYIEKHLVAWLDKPVCEITRAACLERFTEISITAPISANLTFGYLSKLLNYARELHATEDGEYVILPTNPVARMRKIRPMNPEKPRDRRIPLDKIGAVWVELQKRRSAARTIDQRTAADWVCFMLLTGCRLSESASLKWSDVDPNAKTFTLRGETVKNHNEVTLPLSPPLVEILSERKAPTEQGDHVARRRIERSSDYVFASFGQKTPHITGAPGTFEAISKIAGTSISAHDLRRTYEDVATACKIDGDQRRLLINHISGDVHSLHYANNRSALAAAAEAVAAWVQREAKVASSDNVVPLHAPAMRAAG